MSWDHVVMGQALREILVPKEIQKKIPWGRDMEEHWAKRSEALFDAYQAIVASQTSREWSVKEILERAG